jgi:hypothetical protein
VLRLRCCDSLSGVPCTVLVDTGASRSLANASWIAWHGLALQPYAPDVAKTVTNDTVAIDTVVQARRLLMIQRVKMSVQLLPLPNMFGHADIVLGMDWLSKHAAVIDTAARTCSIFRERRMVQLRLILSCKNRAAMHC